MAFWEKLACAFVVSATASPFFYRVAFSVFPGSHVVKAEQLRAHILPQPELLGLRYTATDDISIGGRCDRAKLALLFTSERIQKVHVFADANKKRKRFRNNCDK
ncbi:hypothetical protein DPEC_G00336730 [Dallia pectoralis]|uniref:Uncharacterized protein n=1 Tax=Dallia pectoralis TaxID=75939 RepID=A0ACC2F7B6_DALPE|nr:hypothetical protein DPEC_G00336730 [Dallia pectoralis]